MKVFRNTEGNEICETWNARGWKGSWVQSREIKGIQEKEMARHTLNTERKDYWITILYLAKINFEEKSRRN